MPRRFARFRVGVCDVYFIAAALGWMVTTNAFAEPLRVGFDAVLPPVAYVDDHGQPAGFAADYVRAVAKEAGLEIAFVTGRKEQLQADFQAGRIDAIAALVFSEDRAKVMDFTLPYLSLDAAVFVRKDRTPVRTVGDLHGLRVAVSRGNVTHVYLLAHPEWGAQLVPVASTEEAIAAVDRGECDAAVNVALVAQKIIRDRGLGNVVRAPAELPGFVYKYYMAVHKGDSALVRRLNEAQLAVRDRGDFAHFYEKWIGPLEPRQITLRDLRPLAVPAVLLLVAVTGAFVWQRKNVNRLARQTEALHRSEERLKLVLASGRHALWDWDVPKGEILRSPLLAAKLGYAPEEIAADQDGWRRLVHPEDEPQMAETQRLLHTPGHDEFGFESRLRTRDGGWLWIATAGRVLERDPAGRALRAVGTHTDITARKNAELERADLERKMLQSQKLESLGLLAGGIAHDFNNLLTAIMGNASLAQLPDAPPAEIERAMGETIEAARRAAELCHQMLAYAGERTLAVQPVDLNLLISELAVLLRHSVRKDARIELQLAPDLPLVEGDTSQLRQIVMNLVINAAEALRPGGGTIRVATGRRAPSPKELREAVHVPESAPHEAVCVTVADDGIGMTAETRAKIFDPFFTTKKSGHGLGLAAVLGIVRSHRGVFCVESEPGRGTTFTLFLDAFAAAAPVPARAATAPFADHRDCGPVLVADDEAAVRQMAAAVFRRRGYTVLEAADGDEAVDLLRSQNGSIAAVLLDLTMPRMDGVTALTAMRANQPHLRAILMSGFGAEHILARMPGGGGISVLQKPFTPQELLARFDELFTHVG